MNNVQYLAACAHFFGAYSIVLTIAFVSKNNGWRTILVVLALGTILAGVKEFWYDMNYELPPQTLLYSTEDFVSYIVGGYVGALMVYLRGKKE